MSVNQGTKARAHFGQISVGATTSSGSPSAVTPATLKKIATFTGTVTPTGNSIAAGAVDVKTVAAAGVLVGDAVVAIPPANLEAGLVFSAFVSASDVITVRIANPTAAPITTAVKSWTFLWTSLA